MKQYCKRCVYVLMNCDRLNIQKDNAYTWCCGYTLQEFTNEMGIREYRKYGDLVLCSECGNPIKDPREIRVGRCYRINKNFKCKVFMPTLFWKPLFFIEKLYIKIRKAISKRKKKGNK